MRLGWKDYVFETDEINADSVYAACFLGEYDYLIDSLQNTDVVVDAGANIGAFSVIASKKVNKVFAIEPHPKAFSFLCANVRLNNCYNVVPVNAAISDRIGPAHLVGLGKVLTSANQGCRSGRRLWIRLPQIMLQSSRWT